MFKTIISISISLGFILFFFQNCSEADFSSIESGSKESLSAEIPILADNTQTTEEIPTAEIPIPDVVGQDCTTGKRLSIWSDFNDDGSTLNEDLLGSIVAYQGVKTAVKNYNYYSASAHPEVGPNPLGFQSHIFFYQGPEGLSFNYYHNVDEGGSAYNRVVWDIFTKGNSNKDSVLLSDDGNELSLIEENSEGNFYKSDLEYWYNTDGGIIGPFESTDFKIHVKVFGVGDMTDAAFYSANGDIYSLKNKGDIHSFIIGYNSYEDCK